MKLHYREYGYEDSDPLIILHGLLGSADNWHTPAGHLSGHRHIFSVDQRNHGKSPHLPEMNYPAMAGDLDEFLEIHGIHAADVMGHSMGGKTAMELALSRPEKVNKLIVVDISPFFDRPVYENIFEALVDLDVNSLKARSEADSRLAEKVPDRMLRLFLLKNLRRDDEGNFYWRINLEALNSHYNRIWEPVAGDRVFEGPVLFIEGEKGGSGLSDDFPRIRELFPNAGLERIAGAGHWVHSEQPEAFLDAVKRFLAV